MASGNILGFVPSRWEECIGNRKIVHTYRGLLKQIRLQGKKRAGRYFIHGPSRSGKTATTKLFAQALLCHELNPRTLDPCGLCSACTMDAAQFGQRGLEAYLAQGKVHYLPIDATKFTGVSDVIDLLTELRSYDGTRVVVLDEVHRLQHRAMDEQFLKPIEEKDFIWIASSASTENLELMFLNRFVKLATQLPTAEKLAFWLQDRCEAEAVNYEETALLRLAERAECVPGVALQAIDFASLDPGTGLTLELVEDFEFHIEA